MIFGANLCRQVGVEVDQHIVRSLDLGSTTSAAAAAGAVRPVARVVPLLQILPLSLGVKLLVLPDLVGPLEAPGHRQRHRLGHLALLAEVRVANQRTLKVNLGDVLAEAHLLHLGLGAGDGADEGEHVVVGGVRRAVRNVVD